MSDTPGPWPPPPGAAPSPDPWQPPGGVPPWPTQTPPLPGPLPGPMPGPMPGPPVATALRPGAIPLRPLGLGDILDAAFRIIRRNAGATVGAAVLVAAGSMIVPLIVAAVVSSSPDSLSFLTATGSGSTFDAATGNGLLALGLALGFAGLVQLVGMLLVSAMATPVTLAAAAGRTMTMREAWRATRGQRWRAVGAAVLLAVLSALAAIVAIVPIVVLASGGAGAVSVVVVSAIAVPALLVTLVWGWARLYVLLLPALVGERLGVVAAARRAFTLSRRQFWRIFGIALLTTIMVSIAAQVISFPISLVSQLLPMVAGTRWMGLSLVLGQTLSGVIVAAFTTPVVSVVTALLYVDQRIRKEAFDVELMDQAGLTG